MNELAKLEALATRTGLLAWDGNEDRALENIGKFTRQAAWELRDQGYGNIRTDQEDNVNGLDATRIINHNTGEVYEVVADPVSEQQRAQFMRVDNLHEDPFVEPENQLPPSNAAAIGASTVDEKFLDPFVYIAAYFGLMAYYGISADKPDPTTVAQEALRYAQAAADVFRADGSVVGPPPATEAPEPAHA